MIPLGVLAAATPRASGGDGGGGSDPLWDYVVALWALSEDDVPSDLKQGVVLSKTGTVNVTSAYGTPWGAGKAIYTANAGYLSRSETLYRITTQDFTLEAWVYLLGAPSTLTGFFGMNGTTNSTIRHGLRNTSTGALQYFNSTYSPNFTVTGGSLSAGQWCHVAVSRVGDQILLFLDGELIQTYTHSGASIEGTGTWSSIMAGYARISGDNYNPVVIHSCRETVGVARYTEDFAPPTAPFPNS